MWLSTTFAHSFHVRHPPPRMFRRPRPVPAKNTDEQVDCTPYEHIRYRPFCQTIRLEKRRRAALREHRRRKLPTIMENLCMFEWLHRTGAHKDMTNEELLYVLLNGLFHQDKGNVAIVINRDHKSGKSATCQMATHFGKSTSAAAAAKTVADAYKSCQVSLTVPDELQNVQVTSSLSANLTSSLPTSSASTDVIVLD